MASRDGLPIWLADYLDNTRTLESPTIFHKWVAVATVGLALGRRIWFSREGRESTFPGQMMVALVAASAEMRKTTAINQGKRLLQRVNQLPQYEDGARPVNLLPDRASPQQVLYRLQPRNKMGEVLPDGDCVGAIMAGEMGAYFSQEGYLETLATQVTALNDAPVGTWDEVTESFLEAWHVLDFRVAGETVLRNPCIGMLTGTTPMGLANELPVPARTAGFLGRTLLVYADQSDRPRNALLKSQAPIDNTQALVDGLDWMLRHYQGLVKLTPEAEDCANQWYQEVHGKQLHPVQSAVKPLTGYVGRKLDHVLRVSMCLAAMGLETGNGGALWVKSGHVKYALHMLAEIERGFERCFQYFERGTKEGLEGRLISLLTKPRAMRSHKPYTTDYLIRKMHFHGFQAAQVREALRQLTIAGELVPHAVTVPGRNGHPDYDAQGYRYRDTGSYVKLLLAREATGAEGEEPPDGWEDEAMSENGIRLRRLGKWPQECSDSFLGDEG